MMIRNALAMVLAGVAVAAADDWPQWGRDPSRNMVSPAKGLPQEFSPGEANDDGEFDPAGGKNVAWIARLGSQTYGNAMVAGGRVLVGTNNDPPKSPRREADYGVLLCLNEADGKLAWQLTSPKLAVGAASDYEFIGMCSSPAVADGKAYVVTNRCEVVCLDMSGLANGNDGPFKDEAQYIAGPGKPPVELAATDADILWRYDMRDELGVFPHQASSGNVLVAGDRLYVTTSNGRNWTTKHTPSPDAPALICLDRKTGTLLGREKSGISGRMFLCNWSSPAYASVGGKELVIFGGDDGFLYAFHAEPAGGVLREAGRIDCNPPGYRVKADGKPRRFRDHDGPSGILATPVVVDDRVYVGIGQDPEYGDGAGCFVAAMIDPADGQNALKKLWANEKVGRTMSTAAVADGLVYIADFAGFLHCLEAQTGKEIWKHDTQANIWGSPVLAEGRIYQGNAQGLLVFSAGREGKLLKEIDFGAAVNSTAVIVNGAIIVSTDRHLFAFKAKP